MLWFLQMNLLNIDKTFSCQQEYIDHTLLLYLQLGCQMIVLSDSLRCSEPFWSTCQSPTRPYLITLLPACKHPTRKLFHPCLRVPAPVCVHRTGRRRQVSRISIFQFPRLAGSSTPRSGIYASLRQFSSRERLRNFDMFIVLRGH